MKTILVDAWNTFVLKDGINAEMKELLDSFPNRKIIVTNANEEQMVKFGIVDMPYEVFTLAHEPDKTESEYFRKLLDHFGLAAEDVVYFEHNEDAVKSAESLGIRTHWYDKEKRDLEGLKVFLEENL